MYICTLEKINFRNQQIHSEAPLKQSIDLVPLLSETYASRQISTKLSEQVKIKF